MVVHLSHLARSTAAAAAAAAYSTSSRRALSLLPHRAYLSTSTASSSSDPASASSSPSSSAAAPEPAPNSAAMQTDPQTTTTPKTTHFKVTLTRSSIGLPVRSSRILEALGIKRRMQSVYHAHSPEVAGMILGVKELLRVENVRWQADGDEAAAIGASRAEREGKTGGRWVDAEGREVPELRRKAERGYTVVGSLVDPTRDAEVKQRLAGAGQASSSH